MTNRLFAMLLITTGICLAHDSPAFAQTGKVVLRTRSAVTDVAYSPDGKILAAAHMDMNIRLWDTSSHKILATLQNDKNHVKSLAFSPDGKTLATGAGETVILWNVSTGTPKAKFVHLQPPVVNKFTGRPEVRTQYVTTLAFSPDGMTLATGEDQDKQVRLWDVKTRKVKETFPLHGNTVTATALAFSPDGNTLAVGGAPPFRGGRQGQLGGGVQLWDLTTKKKKGFLSGEVSCIAFSRDGKTLALGSGGGARLYDALSGQPKGEAIGEPEKNVPAFWGVRKPAFSPNTKLLATVNQQVQLWDLSNGNKLWSFKSGGSVAISPDGKSLACGRRDGLLDLWNYKNKKQIATLNDFKTEAVGNIYQMAVTPDGKAVALYLAGGIGLTSTYLVDVGTGEVKARFKSLDAPVFSPDGKFLAAFLNDYSIDKGKKFNRNFKRFIQIWDVETGKQRWTINVPNRSYNVLSFSSDGSTIAVSGSEKCLLLDAKSGKEITSIALGQGGRPGKGGRFGKGGGGLGAPKSVLKFSPDGKHLAIISGRSVEIWDLSTQMCTVAFTPTNRDPRFGFSLKTVSSDLRLLAGSAAGGTIEIWDSASRKRVATFLHKIPKNKFSPGGFRPSPRGGGFLLAFSPDGKILASVGQEGYNAAADTTIRLWDVGKQKEIAKLEGHTASITALAFIHDGKTLASGSRDHTVRYWDVSAFVK